MKNNFLTHFSLSAIIVFVFFSYCGIIFAQENSSPVNQDSSIPEVKEAFPKNEPVDLYIDGIRLYSDLYVGIPAEIEATIVNDTGIEANDVTIGFASGDGAVDRKIISVAPKRRQRVSFLWSPKTSGKQNISISIIYTNDPNAQNNQQAELVEVRNESFVDVRVADVKVPLELIVNQMASVEVTVVNDSDVEIKEANVILNTDDGFKDLKRILLRPRSSEYAFFSWVPRNAGSQFISISIECKEDLNSGNNELKVPLEVKLP